MESLFFEFLKRDEEAEIRAYTGSDGLHAFIGLREGHVGVFDEISYSGSCRPGAARSAVDKHDVFVGLEMHQVDVFDDLMEETIDLAVDMVFYAEGL